MSVHIEPRDRFGRSSEEQRERTIRQTGHNKDDTNRELYKKQYKGTKKKQNDVIHYKYRQIAFLIKTISLFYFI